MNVFIDIETVPDQREGAFESFLNYDNVKCPFTTKTQIGEDLNMQPEEYKFIGADDFKLMWVNKKGSEQAVIQAEQEYRKTSFDGARGEIISIAFAVEDSEVVTYKRDGITESELISGAFEHLRSELGGKSPWFIGHNIGGFDLKFLFQRCVINRIDPKVDLKQWGRHAANYYDTMQAWAGFGNRISQDNLCKALGIEGKPCDISGANVWDHYKAGNIARIAEYNAQDVETVRKIYARLNFQS